MKKIVIVNSSPRTQGNCDLLCTEFGRGALTNDGNVVTRIDLKDINMDFYREEQEEDDIVQIAQSLLDSNVIVLATPVYFYNMSGMMKTFIDRMHPYFSDMADKDFYFILTAAINQGEMEATVDSLSGFTDSLPGSQVVHVIYASNISDKGQVREHPAYQEAYEIGSRIL